MKIRENYTCPLELTHDIIRGKWKPIILWQLGQGSSTLAQLERDINDVTQKMLLEHLNELLYVGVIDKNAFEGYPLRAEYVLTARGSRLLQAIAIMQEVGIELMKENGMDDILRGKGFIE